MEGQTEAIERCTRLEAPPAPSADRPERALEARPRPDAGPQGGRMVHRGGLPPHALKRVTAYIDANLARAIRVDHLAAEAGLSPFHFIRAFKQSVGSTPHQFVVARRIDRARQLLLETRMAVLDIALATGFADHSHFSRHFHRVMGASPRQYRLDHG